ncbi:MAG TPA: hypothetical protein VI776_03875 [Anaerolineales bacterium]|nr:hypothetical protein [Anaerolineales bacterium]
MNAARKTAWFTVLIILSQLLIACGGDDGLPRGQVRGPNDQTGYSFVAPQQSTYPVDPVFEDFYEYLGGEARLGPAISAAGGSASQKQQFVQAALLVYDSLAPESERFGLAPLGRQFNSGQGRTGGTLEILDGTQGNFRVSPEFLSLYEAIGGARFTGPTLGEARYNPDKARWEQYFENLGFYRLDQDEQVRLMAYGASACDFRCRYRPPADSLPNRTGVMPEPFAGRVKVLGQSFTGSLLVGPRMAADGQQEVIFENLVLVIDRSSLVGVAARPLPEVVGIQSQPPVPRDPDPLMVFYPLKGNLGHNVPQYFETYLEQHGGLAVSGLPTSEVTVVQPGFYRQCFTNLCLDFDLTAAEGNQLFPTPLGAVYRDIAVEPLVSFEQTQSLEGIDLQIWEGRTFVSSEEIQQVHVAVFEDGLPLKNREPVISLALPDGSQLRYHFPPTGEDGLSSLSLPAIAASSGTLIAYQVCLNGLAGEKACVSDNFMIWNHP